MIDWTKLSNLAPEVAMAVVGCYFFLKVVTILKDMADNNEKRNNKKDEKLSKAITTLAKSFDRVAEATEKGNQEAKDRNGHLAELVIQQGKNTQKMAETATKSVIKAMANLPAQHIEHQQVDTQEIKQ